jgi:two-component system, sensor histidine kinase YesM
VENAIVHGIVQQGGHILIKAYVKSGLLKISISDNGKGITELELTKLKRLIENQQNISSEKHNGIALSNVHERLQLLYGKQFGIFIDGREKSGFSVTLTIPIQRMGEELRERNISS